jgi:hypothetical protein
MGQAEHSVLSASHLTFANAVPERKMALVQQLNDLYLLYKDGALTTEEFTQAKAATISGIPQAQINIEATSMALVEVEEPCSICLNPPADRDPGESFPLSSFKRFPWDVSHHAMA